MTRSVRLAVLVALVLSCSVLSVSARLLLENDVNAVSSFEQESKFKGKTAPPLGKPKLPKLPKLPSLPPKPTLPAFTLPSCPPPPESPVYESPPYVAPPSPVYESPPYSPSPTWSPSPVYKSPPAGGY